MNNCPFGSVGKLSLIGLLAGVIPVVALPVSAEETTTSIEQSSTVAETEQNSSITLNLDAVQGSGTSSTDIASTSNPVGLETLDSRSTDRSLPQAAPISATTTVQRVSDLESARESDRPANPMAQVTSVSQLSDVQPTDWAFQALQSLVERYGVIAGYPDGTYRGNRAMTRYEFAAGLNAALDRVNELIAAGLEDAVTREDLATLQRLQEEFAAELATLRGRVDALEARTAELEANQFSTTTRLSGEVIFSVADAWGAYPGATDPEATPGILSFTNGAEGRDAETVFNYRTRLNLTTSFNGGDLLITGLQAYNFLGDPSSLQGSLGYTDVLGLNASQVRLGYEPQFPGTDPRTLTPLDPNTFRLYKLLYIFPSGIDNLTLFAGTNAETSDAFPAITPFASEGQGAISRFAGYNSAVRVSGGTSGQGLAAAAGFIWTPTPGIDLRALYGNVNSFIAQNNPLDATTVGNGTATPLGAGVFGGSSVVAAQLTLRPTRSIDIGINYANSYHQINILGTGLASADIGSVLFNPSGRCDTNGFGAAAGGFGCSATPGGALDRGATLVSIASEPIRLNSIGATATWRFAPRLAFTASAAYLFADLVNVDASTTFSSWMVGLHAADIFREGNSAGLIFGKPLSRVSTGGEALDTFENATPLHLEGYINFRVTDNISVTPGVFFVFNPEGYSGNETAAVGVLRTTFTF